MKRRRSIWPHVIVTLLAIAGLAVSLYPMTMQWFSAHARSQQLVEYAQSSEQVGNEENEQLLDRARDYNSKIPEILVNDPYSPIDAEEHEVGAWDEYMSQLDTGSEVMARVRIPSINVDLPILHGTSEDALRKGVGHVFGSSLPVGGEGTHSVLTGHTALTEAKMFDDLVDLKKGDEFVITVAGEDLAYRVEDIRVVVPSDVSSLQLEPGKDYVTLITCTPRAVNSHRLLVRGARVELSDELSQGALRVGPSAGFPWWAAWFTGGSLLIVAGSYLLARPDLWPASRKKRSS
ncbi:MAG: class C sortase [Ancrocorticia sp.]